MPFYYALRDAFGILDVLEDSRATLRGGVSYRKYEPVEGGMHQGAGRERRIRAGLRYTKGGQQKYWLPMPEEEHEPTTGPLTAIGNFLEDRRIQKDGYAPMFEDQEEHVITDETVNEQQPQSHGIFSAAPQDLPAASNSLAFTAPVVDSPDAELEDLEFHDPDEDEDALYAESQKLLFGDYHYPCIDVSSERARKSMWDEEERILTDRRAAAFSPMRSSGALLGKGRRGTGGGGYGATADSGRGESSNGKGKGSVYATGGEDVKAPGKRKDSPVPFDETKAIIDMAPEVQKPELQVDGVKLQLSNRGRVVPASPPRGGAKKVKSPSMSRSSQDLAVPSADRPALSAKSSTLSMHSESHLPDDAVDLVVEDPGAAEEVMTRERRKGEPAVRQSGQRKVYKSAYTVEGADGEEKDVDVEHEVEPGVKDDTRVTVRDSSEESRLVDDGEELGGSGVEVKLTRAVEPPPFAVVEVDRYGAQPTPSPSPSPFVIATDDDDNPWK